MHQMRPHWVVRGRSFLFYTLFIPKNYSEYRRQRPAHSHLSKIDYPDSIILWVVVRHAERIRPADDWRWHAATCRTWHCQTVATFDCTTAFRAGWANGSGSVVAVQWIFNGMFIQLNFSKSLYFPTQPSLVYRDCWQNWKLNIMMIALFTFILTSHFRRLCDRVFPYSHCDFVLILQNKDWLALRQFRTFGRYFFKNCPVTLDFGTLCGVLH